MALTTKGIQFSQTTADCPPNSSVYLNKTADLNIIVATDLAVQRPLHERFGDTNSAYR